jgi:hypothetical protein
MHHTLMYHTTTAAAVTLSGINAVTDTVFTINNNNFIFTDQLSLVGASGMATDLTQCQLYSPSLLPYGLFNIWPVNATLVPPSYPRLLDLREMPFPLPTNEQVQFYVSDSNAAGEAVTGTLWVVGPNWKRGRYVGSKRAIFVVTASQAIVAGAWSGLGAVTFQQTPIGGWWVVNAAWCFAATGATTRAYRLYFPRSPGYGSSGRQMRPGDYVSHTMGDMVTPGWASGLGPWGAFHTFEPLTVEIYGDTTGAATQTIYLDCDYAGQGDAGGTYPLAA